MKYQYKNFQQLMLLRLVRLQKYRHEESGFVLVIVISMVLILTSLLAAYALLSKIETASTKSSISSNTGFYSAEAGLNLRAKQTKDTFDGFNRPTGTSPGSWQDCLDNDNANDGSYDFKCEKKEKFNKNQTLLSYVKEIPDNPVSIQIGTGEPFAGLSAQEYRYNVTSIAVNSQDLPSAILEMRFKSRLVPLFQFVVFYDNDAEFTNPPSMSLNGPIHSNGDLYLNSGSGALTINGLISTVGKLYRGEKADNTCGSTVTINKTPSTTQNLNCSGTSRREYTQSQVSDWNNLINVGIPKLVVPAPDTLDPTPGKLYWDKADLRVVLKLDSITGNPSGIEIRNQDNTLDTTNTTALRDSCPTNTATTTTLKNEGAGDPNYEKTDTILNVNSATNFNVNDVVRVGTDYDSNVIVSKTATTITLKRQLGHAYQLATIASTGDTVSKVSVSTSDTFYNYREKNSATPLGSNGSPIRMLNVDVQGLLDCIKANSLMGNKLLDDNTDGGLVWFLTVDGPRSTIDTTLTTTPANTHNDYAVRLYNGKYLYSGQSSAPEIKGLTIVSDQAVYLQGDYNLKDNPATTGVNEGNNPLTTTVTERWRPASILADTINILSNAWTMDDSNGRTYVSNIPTTTTNIRASSGVTATAPARVLPTATTVNAAFLAGTTITGGSNGTPGQNKGNNSGGVNNYPRFHEDWNGTVAFNYKGSFVSLNAPRRTNSPFCGSYAPTTCNIYTPPIRNWDFDTDFTNAANLPPLTPRAVYLRQEVFSRNFEQ